MMKNGTGGGERGGLTALSTLALPTVPAKKLAVSTVFQTQLWPPIFLKKFAETKPEIQEVNAYSKMAAEFIAWCLWGEKREDEGEGLGVGPWGAPVNVEHAHESQYNDGDGESKELTAIAWGEGGGER